VKTLIELLYFCDDEKAVERLRSLGVEVEVSRFDVPVELLEAVGVSLPEWLSRGSNRLEVLIRVTAEKYSMLKTVDGCTPASYRVEIQCDTEECAARAATMLARAGASVYRRGMLVYGLGEGDAEKIIRELTADVARPYSQPGAF